MQDVIRNFIGDARAILAAGPTDEALVRLLAKMRTLVQDPAVLEGRGAFLERSEHPGGAAHLTGNLYTDTGRRSEVLYTDPSGLTLVRSRFLPDEPTPVHSHGTWGVLGVYAGRDLHRSYRRQDGGTGAGRAVLELTDERVLTAGEVALIPRPPQDIHAQQGYGGEPAFELVLFGKNAMVIPRLIFDLERATAREVIPGRG